MKLEMRRDDDDDEDWFMIERAEHDGRVWVEQIGPNAMALRMSCRFSDADVEGPYHEMRTLAEAIKARKAVSFKRCAVDATRDEVALWSPRNSTKRGLVSIEDAEALADEIIAAEPKA